MAPALCALLRHSFVIDPNSFVLQQRQERFYKRVEAERSLARWCSGQHPLRPKETRRAENTSAKGAQATRNLFCFADLFFSSCTVWFEEMLSKQAARWGMHQEDFIWSIASQRSPSCVSTLMYTLQSSSSQTVIRGPPGILKSIHDRPCQVKRTL